MHERKNTSKKTKIKRKEYTHNEARFTTKDY